MVAWTSAQMGDLEESLRMSTDALADVQPGQASNVVLVAAAWRIWALAMLGRWAEVRGALEAAHDMWVDAGRLSAGFTLHGFVAAHQVATARRDEAMRTRAIDVIDEIGRQFADGNPLLTWLSLARLDFRVLGTILVRYEQYLGRTQLVEMALAACLDHGRPVPGETLDALAREGAARGLRLLEAQALRGQGLAEQNPARMAGALDIYEASKAVPRAAVITVELGRIRGDRVLVERGLAALESLGDLVSLERLGGTTATA
jgi:hypothetical protein